MKDGLQEIRDALAVPEGYALATGSLGSRLFWSATSLRVQGIRMLIETGEWTTFAANTRVARLRAPGAVWLDRGESLGDAQSGPLTSIEFLCSTRGTAESVRCTLLAHGLPLVQRSGTTVKVIPE